MTLWNNTILDLPSTFAMKLCCCLIALTFSLHTSNAYKSNSNYILQITTYFVSRKHENIEVVVLLWLPLLSTLTYDHCRSPCDWQKIGIPPLWGDESANCCFVGKESSILYLALKENRKGGGALNVWFRKKGDMLIVRLL